MKTMRIDTKPISGILLSAFFFELSSVKFFLSPAKIVFFQGFFRMCGDIPRMDTGGKGLPVFGLFVSGRRQGEDIVADNSLRRRSGRPVGMEVQICFHRLTGRGHNRFLPRDGSAGFGARPSTCL